MSYKIKSFWIKKVIIFVFIFLFSSPVLAMGYDWKDLNVKCFKDFASVTYRAEKTFEVKLYPVQDLLFVQNGKFLPFKSIQKSSPTTDINYEIIELQGEIPGDNPKLKYFNDGNFNTIYSFVSKEGLPKSIIIDAKDVLRSGSFDVKVNFSGVYKLNYYISMDGDSYMEVAKAEDFDFRYLKIVFEKALNNTKEYQLFVNGITISRDNKNIYLVKPVEAGEIYIYGEYDCSDENFLSVYLDIQNNSLQDNFKISSETTVFNVDFVPNSLYDDDFDKDNVENSLDNCPNVSNYRQLDSDKDGLGDVCDLDSEVKNFNEKDSDKDGVGDASDNCPYIYNPKQKDLNADGHGDLCVDDDHDGYTGIKDNCIYISNRDQKDINANGVGDACEFDRDGDGIFDSIDNCVNKENASQEDSDKDEVGDLCDNCNIYNPQQLDKNKNGVGDRCEEVKEYVVKNDDDGDGILNNKDNCKNIKNADQKDRDRDGVGDLCDNCIKIKNRNQKDDNKNGVGDLCDDVDGDGIIGYLDNCPDIDNADQSDIDNDGVGDVCGDSDKDRMINAKDNCPYKYNPEQRDVDRDGIGDVCDDADNRVVESNKTLFKIFIGVVTLVFGGLIFFMFIKMKKEDLDDEENNKLN